jgi:hypothetical protein
LQDGHSENPPDLVAFSIDYFKKLVESPPMSAAGYRITLQQLQELQESLLNVLKGRAGGELRRVDYQVTCDQLGLCSDVLAPRLPRQGVIDLRLFMRIGSTLVSPSFKKRVVNMFKIFEDEHCQSKIPTVAFRNFYEFMAAKDSGILAANVQKLNDSATDEFHRPADISADLDI